MQADTGKLDRADYGLFELQVTRDAGSCLQMNRE
jgi:hypothetical protein